MIVLVNKETGEEESRFVESRSSIAKSYAQQNDLAYIQISGEVYPEPNKLFVDGQYREKTNQEKYNDNEITSRKAFELNVITKDEALVLGILTFDEHKQLLLQKSFLKYREVLDQGVEFNSIIFNCDSDHIHALDKKIQSSNIPFDWPNINYTSKITLNSLSEANSFFSTLYSRAEYIKNNYYNNLLISINQCTTSEELQLIDINSGWQNE